MYGAGRIFLFFYIVSYFFKIVKSGTYATSSRSARSVKKLPYVGPIGDTGFVVKADVKTDLSHAEVRTRALRAGILLRTESAQNGTVSLLLSCSGLHSDTFSEALTVLRETCFPEIAK